MGSTICYAFLQAGGIVNDHMVYCFRYRELERSEGYPASGGFPGAGNCRCLQ
jgi:hypothetical protein